MKEEPQPHWLDKYYPFVYPDEYSDAQRDAALEAIKSCVQKGERVPSNLNSYMIHILSGITDSELKALEDAVNHPPQEYDTDEISARLTLGLTLRRLTSAVRLAGFIEGNLKDKP